MSDIRSSSPLSEAEEMRDPNAIALSSKGTKTIDDLPKTKPLRKRAVKEQTKDYDEDTPMDDDEDEEVGTPKPAPKKKPVAAKKGLPATAEAEGNSDSEFFAEPVTPTPKKRAAAMNYTGFDGEDGSPMKKRKKAPEKVVKATGIPTCEAELTEADKMMLDWKKSGKGWGEIRAEWKRITGMSVGKSTLPNRHARVIANIAVFPKEDVPILLEAKREIEETFECEKWNAIKKNMEDRGSQEHTVQTLQKQFKKLEEERLGMRRVLPSGAPTSAPATPGVADTADDEDNDVVETNGFADKVEGKVSDETDDVEDTPKKVAATLKKITCKPKPVAKNPASAPVKKLRKVVKSQEKVEEDEAEADLEEEEEPIDEEEA